MVLHTIAVFRPWVSEWLAQAVIFAILLTALFGFGLYSSNPESAMGFYGIEPADVQYSVVVMYAAGVSFLALDFRIVKYFTARKYLLIGLALNTLSYIICFYTKNWGLFLCCRFIQGIVSALLCSIVLNMIFPRLHATRSRLIGYTVFYCGLQVSIPICAIYCSSIVHYFEFNWLFLGLIMLSIPVWLAVLITMHPEGRFQKKIPLYQVDYVGSLFYFIFCLILGYLFIYGQSLNWFDSSLTILLAFSGSMVFVLFVVRELRLKRPLIDLRSFKVRNFVIGLLLLFAFYVFKGTISFTYGYVGAVLGTDPLNVIPMWVANIGGICLSMFVTARFLLMGKPIIRIIIFGFGLLALYYGYMLAFVSVSGETGNFIFPLFLYGAATGTLFVPIVVFTVSAAPAKTAFSASLIGIFARFVGFCASIAINNYIQLYTKATALDKLRESVNEINPQTSLTLQRIQDAYLEQGNDMSSIKMASANAFSILIKEQVLARSIRENYDIMLIGLLGLIVLLILIPRLNNVFLKIRKGNVPY